LHQVEDSTYVRDGHNETQWRFNLPAEIFAEWQIVDGSADDVRVCGAHPWQSPYLVFANGRRYGTASCNIPQHKGNAQFALQ
jgi:hypothetical protein